MEISLWSQKLLWMNLSKLHFQSLLRIDVAATYSPVLKSSRGNLMHSNIKSLLESDEKG